MHPRSRTSVCRYGENCSKSDCQCLHSPERDERLRTNENSLELNHPLEQPTIYDQPDACSDLSCTYLHRSDSNLLEDKHDLCITIEEITKINQFALFSSCFYSVIGNNFYYFLSFIPISLVFLIMILLDNLFTMIDEINIDNA
jgi:hypothetical protein